MIPFVKHVAIGLPYHGPIIGSTLTLPNSGLKTAPTPSDGAVYVMKNPLPPGANRSPEEQAADTAAGKEWRNYLLVTDADRKIGGISLGYNRWLYCDGNGRPWVIRAECVIVDTSNFKVKITLESLFSRFSRVNQYSQINRTLVEQSFSVSVLDLADTAYIHASTTDELGIDQNEAGTEAVFNIYTQESAALNQYEKFKYKNTDTALVAYFDIDITGNGSVDPGGLGNGVNCTLTFGANRSTFTTTNETINNETISLPIGNLNQTSCSAAPADEYGTFLGDEPGPGGECYTYIKQFSLVHSFDNSYTQDKRTIIEYDTKLRRVFDGNTAGWLKFFAVTESGRLLSVNTSGEATKWIQTDMSWDEPSQTCSVDSVTEGYDQTARSGSALEQSHSDVSVTLYGITGSVSNAKLNRTGLNYKTILNHDPPFISNPGGICSGVGGEWQAGTPFDTVSGEDMTIELLNGRTANLKTASQVINCISAEGGTYSNSTFENVSYQPELDLWNTDASNQTSWA